MKNLGTLLTAMVTPFKENLTVDYDKAQELAVHLIENGSDGIVLHGTTGESPTLTHEEEYELYRVVKQAIGNKGTIIAGTGSNSTATTILSTIKAEEIGVDGALILVPYYNKPSQEGQYQHFKAVAEATKLPLIIYNIPGRTGVNMLPETIARINEIENYAGIKEAAGDLNQVSQIRKLTRSDFLIWSGDDSLTLPMLAVGGCGVVSVASQVVGNEIKEMIDAYFAGNFKKAQEIHFKLWNIFKALFITTNPSPVKAALNMIGFNVGKPRLPLVEPNAKEKEIIEKALKELGLIK
jgi:4-hydroxy-tetrahydrodipicolinate synthase